MAKHVNHSGGQGQGLLGAPLRTVTGLAIIAFALAFGIDYLYPSLPVGARQAVDNFARGGIQKLADTIIKITE